MTLRIGLVGSGRRAAYSHAPAIVATPETELAGVWSRSPEAAQSLAYRYDVPAARTFDELLDRCEAIALALPPAVQPEFAAIASRRGKAVLLERPVAADLAGAEELARAVQVAGVVSQIALMWRYSATVRQFLDSQVPATYPEGATGKVISGALAAPRARAWQVHRGVLMDQGVDLVDLLDAALGPIVSIRAHGDLQGWIGLQLEHQVGRFSEASMYATAEAGVNLATVEVFGPGGAAEVDCASVVDADSFRTLYQEFAEAVKKGAAPELDANRGLRLQHMIEAAETELLAGA
jgi:predicted dehydrogenase